MDELLRKLLYHFRRRKFEAELDEEMQHHLAMSGRPQFGNVSQLKEESRSMWTWTWVEQLGQDLRYAFRSMLANKVFATLAIVSLALGIGANTAIYSFVDAILLRSLPVQDPERLVVLKWRGTVPKQLKRMVKASSSGSYEDKRLGLVRSVFSYPALDAFQQQTRVFSNVFGYLNAGRLKVVADGEAALAQVVYATGDYFRGAGTGAAAGRLWEMEDDRIGAPAVAVVTAAYAQQRLGGMGNAVGRQISISDVPFTVIGVAPPGFFGVNPEWNPDVFVPVHTNVLLEQTTSPFGPTPAQSFTMRNFDWVEIMGRLQAGITHEQARAALTPIFAELMSDVRSPTELLVIDGAGGLDSLRRRYSQPLYVLMTLVGLILAIACANIANLLLARSAARRREIAVRLSMGAGRGRVIRQLLTESFALASIGAMLGVLVALWGVRVLTALLGGDDPSFTLRAELNWNVLGVTAALAVFTGLLFGFAPAFQATRVNVIPALKEVRSGNGGRRRRWMPMTLSRALIVAQIAVSLLLLVAAGLFVRTLVNLQSLELGFNEENLLVVQVNAQRGGYRGPALVAFYQDLQERLRRIPGVRDVSSSSIGQLVGGSYQLNVTVPGSAAPQDAPTKALPIGTGYFKTLQIPLVLGRGIEETDTVTSQKVAVVSESFAKQHFGNENPIGRRLNVEPTRDFEIVGVAKDVRYGSLKEEPGPLVYFALYQVAFPPVNQMTYVVRTAGDPASQANAVRDVVRRADPGVPLGNIRTQASQVASNMSQEIVFARLCTAFAVLALLIACVGLYGTTAYNVARRTGEIGIRMALGARRGPVLRMVLREVAVLAFAGLIIGIPTALATSRFVESLLFGTEPNDTGTVAVAVAILMAAALAAALAPARRASKIDPMVALRHE